ncbi:hypothetical protein EDB83DRAFT_2318751 [Lactarius deliciosus]|nr:hypothetical protein EDB83DRAFT_2318751 [Lactarius deliciosus]
MSLPLLLLLLLLSLPLSILSLLSSHLSAQGWRSIAGFAMMLVPTVTLETWNTCTLPTATAAATSLICHQEHVDNDNDNGINNNNNDKTVSTTAMRHKSHPDSHNLDSHQPPPPPLQENFHSNDNNNSNTDHNDSNTDHDASNINNDASNTNNNNKTMSTTTTRHDLDDSEFCSQGLIVS